MYVIQQNQICGPSSADRAQPEKSSQMVPTSETTSTSVSRPISSCHAVVDQKPSTFPTSPIWLTVMASQTSSMSSRAPTCSLRNKRDCSWRRRVSFYSRTRAPTRSVSSRWPYVVDQADICRVVSRQVRWRSWLVSVYRTRSTRSR